MGTSAIITENERAVFADPIALELRTSDTPRAKLANELLTVFEQDRIDASRNGAVNVFHAIIGEEDFAEYSDFVSWRWGVPEEYMGQLRATLANFQIGKPGSKSHMWQAWRAGRPISKAGMYLATGSAGIYAVATRPEARRLGLAGILTLTALKKAQKLGKTLAVLHSTPMAESLYQSFGFETIAEFRLFASEEVHI